MISFAHIGILIGICPVEQIQAMRIIREMGRHPVKQYTYPRFMKGVHEFHKRLWVAET